MTQRRCGLRAILSGCAALLVPLSAGSAATAAAPVDPASELLAVDNLVAWCIVPFDRLERGPVERLAMLERLGFTQYAWDWRDQHVPDLPRELALAREAGIRMRAVWLWIDGRQDRVGELGPGNRAVLGAVAAAGQPVEFWLGFHENVFNQPDPAERIRAGAAMVRYLLELTAESGSTVALYNHGGWFGESRNQLAILAELGDPRAGIVYNFHHAHHEIAEWPENLRRMLPHLRAVNLNGMKPDGPKILPLGAGTHELEMLRELVRAGYRGPIGILGHVEDADVEEILRANLAGLRALAPKVGTVP